METDTFSLDSMVFRACAALGLPHSTWLTSRRTYASWSRDVFK